MSFNDRGNTSMFKSIQSKVWVFDVEWVPDPVAGRLLYQLPDAMSEEDVVQEMWREGGATEEEPMPYLKTVLCRVVSISALTRHASSDEIKLNLISLPRDPKDPSQVSEAHIVGTFLNAIGAHRPQLIGFNSQAADLKILMQRGVANGIQATEFCRRPDKPWEGVDYFARGSNWNIDLMEILGGWGKSTPSLHEMVTVCGIPGKIALEGHQVAPLWLRGELDRIIAYNEFDTVSTYLLWLRLAHFGGFLSTVQYEEEQKLLWQFLSKEAETPLRSHLQDYLKEWEKLRAVIA
jgi:predicted PolB exonuclease-like 3'-5' exonuclease